MTDSHTENVANPIAEMGRPTMTPRQIALWVESLNAKPKPKTIPGPAMTLRGSRKHHPKPPEKPNGACVHRWRIEEPNGATCEGFCRLCGATKTFRTCPEEQFTAYTIKAER